jgi:transglutaminase-like putative cysteine protease
MRRFEIVHSTRFRYSAPIAETIMEVRLRPMDGRGQRCLEFELDVSSRMEPGTYMDGYGNHVHYFNLVRNHQGVSVISRSVVETGGELETDPGEDLVLDFLRYRSPVKDVPGVRELARRHPIDDPTSGPAAEKALDDLALTINREFAYDRAVTNVYSSVDDVLELRAGVCQDFAHLFVAVARAMRVPARYVSGYIQVSREPGAREGASHAWAEAWVPGVGWIGYDATHPIRAGENHVRVAVGRDYRDAAPTRGIYIGAAIGTMEVKVRTRSIPAS